MKQLIETALRQSYSYPEYRLMLTKLLARGMTTGPIQDELHLRIAHLNQARMDRLDKRPRFIPAMEAQLAGLRNDYVFLVLTEGWCGDAAQIVPVLQHMAAASPRLNLRLILRDEHPELMDLFLTDGGRSIPKVLVLDATTNAVVADWGPRPATAQRLSMDYKYLSEPKPDYETHHKELHTWYARDKTVSTQMELLSLLADLE